MIELARTRSWRVSNAMLVAPLFDYKEWCCAFASFSIFCTRIVLPTKCAHEATLLSWCMSHAYVMTHA